MDIAYDKRDLINQLYDSVYIPEILKVPGVLKASRYHTSNESEPRYLAIFEIASPTVLDGLGWEKAVEDVSWSPQIRSDIFNHHSVVYKWLGGGNSLTYRTRYLFCACMDVEPHKETVLNQVYDKEHIPLMTKVPGCLNAIRYKAPTEVHPSYLAIYEIERPDLPTTEPWRKASDTGRWKPEVRPYTYNRHRVVYERIGEVKTV